MTAGAVGIGGADLLNFIRRGRSFSGHEENCAFLNTGETRFADISAVSGLGLDDDGRAIGRVDWDHDGDIDLWVVNRNGPQLRLLRNSLPAVNHHVAIRLRGTSCNRDAIGATVELLTSAPDVPTLRKTLRAGDGYLAQSSKWLHFGLGQLDKVDQIVVTWPDGSVEQFEGVGADGRYLIQQGQSEPPRTMPRREGVQLAQTDAKPPTRSDEIHVLSLSYVPMPQLSYRTYEDQLEQVFVPSSGQPVLVTLWASWCTPCLTELAELAKNKDRIDAANLDVVALSVTEISGNVSGEDSQSVLRRIGFPYRSGVADSGLVEKLQLVNNHLFDLHLSLPVPLSVLIDGEGRLAALYRGRVSVDRVLRDVATLDGDREQRRRASARFAGRWHEPLNSVTVIPLLNALTSGGFLREADDFARRLPAARKEMLLPALVRLGMEFYLNGNGATAQEHFHVAVRIDPTFVGVENALGLQREREGRPASAVKLYREALRRNPNSIMAMNNLAWLLATHPDDSIRDGAEAVRLAEQAAQISKSRNPTILDTLATTYAEAGDFDKAISVARKAIELAKAGGRLALVDSIGQRAAMYQEGRPFRSVREP